MPSSTGVMMLATPKTVPRLTVGYLRTAEHERRRPERDAQQHEMEDPE
jgi:hypothetical protein